MMLCTLASSSSGNCTIVSHGKTHMLIDAGISLRRIKDGLRHAGLVPDEITGILVTHEHSDHINGIKMLAKYYKIPIFSSFGTGYGINSIMPEVEPFINCFEIGVDFELGDIAVRSFSTPHDTDGSVGYILQAGGNTIAYVTDLGYVTDEVLNATLGADLAVIEANHDRDMVKNGSYPNFLKRRVLSERGHLANCDSGSFATKLVSAGARYIQLSHLSRENNTPKLARETVELAMAKKGISVGKDVELDIAPSYTMSRSYVL